MVNQTLARRYAVAVSSLAGEQQAADRVGSELAAVAGAIGDNTQAREFFLSPVISKPDKERILTGTFEGKLHPIALHTLLLLVRKRREQLLPAIVVEYVALQRAARGAQTLTLTSARTLDRSEYAALVQRLEHIYGKKFDATEVVDPALIGGLRIMLGDRRIDATIAGRLDALARDLGSQ
ncbi:MAG TPA: ATP synthase F1 subunit delta [Candidatus Cybelea sp.]